MHVASASNSTLRASRALVNSTSLGSASIRAGHPLKPHLHHHLTHHRHNAQRLHSHTTPVVAAMTLSYPKPIEYQAKSKPATAAVIFFHGLGDSAQGWTDVASVFQAQLPHIKFVFPTAARMPVTINMGSAMNSWFDIASLSGINTAEDAAGIAEARRYAEELVAKEVAAGVPANRVVVGGFSQGGAVALSMMRSDVKLAGVIGLSTWMPLHKQTIVSPQNKDTKVFMGHGSADQVVAYAYGKESATKLQEAGANVEFKTYRGMAHSACNEELQDIASFLSKVLP